MCIKVHENTVEKAKEVIKSAGKNGLRIKTCGSSCSGVNFEVFPDNKMENDFVVTDNNGIKIIMDKSMKSMFQDAMIEYKQTMLGWQFKIY